MDLVTHSLASVLGLRLLRGDDAGPMPRGWLLSTCLVGFLPDLDSVTYLVSPDAYLAHHRGCTHSLLLVPLAWLVLTRVRRRLFPGAEGRVLEEAWGLAMMLHVLMDWTTAFGTGVLEPLVATRFTLRWFYVFDPVLFGLLAAAALAPRAGWRWRWVAALAVYVGLAAAGTAAADRVADQLGATDRAYPMFLAPHRRLVPRVPEAPDARSQAVIDPVRGMPIARRGLAIDPDEARWLEEVAATPAGARYLAWARAPHVAVDRATGRLEVVDLRYPPLLGRRIFVLAARVDPATGHLDPGSVQVANHRAVGSCLVPAPPFAVLSGS